MRCFPATSITFRSCGDCGVSSLVLAAPVAVEAYTVMEKVAVATEAGQEPTYSGELDRTVKSNSVATERISNSARISNSLAAASGAVEATTRKASIMIQKNFRGQQARNEVKREFHVIALQARMCSKATSSFKKLTKPRRPPFPGTATPPGYVINMRRPPQDRDRGERFRDWLLLLGTHRWVAALQLVWILALVAVFVVFACCLMYW